MLNCVKTLQTFTQTKC